MTEFTIKVDTTDAEQKFGRFGRRELIAAERKGITKLVKLGRGVARSLAPVASGAGRRGISYRVRTRGGGVEGRVSNKVFYMRFQARGTGPRFTGRHAYRGVLPAVPFIEGAAAKTDPIAKRVIEESVEDALEAAGLL